MKKKLKKILPFLVLAAIGCVFAIAQNQVFATDTCLECDNIESQVSSKETAISSQETSITSSSDLISDYFSDIDAVTSEVSSFLQSEIEGGHLYKGEAGCSESGFPSESTFTFDNETYCFPCFDLCFGNSEFTTDVSNHYSSMYLEMPSLENTVSALNAQLDDFGTLVNALLTLQSQLTVLQSDLNGCYSIYPICEPCSSDSDCGSGYICSLGQCIIEEGGGGGTIIDDEECQTDSDCSTYEVCENAVCNYIYCEENSECGFAEKCDSETLMCTEASCNGDSDCESGESCIGDSCLGLLDTGITTTEALMCVDEECELCNPCPNCDDLINLYNFLKGLRDTLYDNVNAINGQIDEAQAELDEMEQMVEDYKKMVEESGGDIGDDCEDLRNASLDEMPSKSLWGIAHRFGNTEYCFRKESDLEDFIDKLHEWNQNHPGANSPEEEIDRLKTDLNNLKDIKELKDKALDDVHSFMDELADDIDDCIFELELCRLFGHCTDVEIPENPAYSDDSDDSTGDSGDDTNGVGDSGEDDGWSIPEDGEESGAFEDPEEPKINPEDDLPEDFEEEMGEDGDSLCPDCDVLLKNYKDAKNEVDELTDIKNYLEDEIWKSFQSFDQLIAAEQEEINAFKEMVESSGGKTGSDCDGFEVGSGQAAGVMHRFGDTQFCFTSEAQINEFLKKLEEYDKEHMPDPEAPTEKELTDKIASLFDVWSDIVDSLEAAEEWAEIKAFFLKLCIEHLTDLQEQGFCMDVPVPELPQELQHNEMSFIDVIGHWALIFIEKLFDTGIIEGRDETHFAPNEPIIRAELVKLAIEVFKSNRSPVNISTRFSDIENNAWYSDYILQAEATGCIHGYGDGTFKPNQPIQRVEALKILVCMSGISLHDTTIDQANFSDTIEGAWYTDYLNYAVSEEFVSGYVDGSFGPANNLLRGEASKIVVLMMEKFGL